MRTAILPLLLLCYLTTTAQAYQRTEVVTVDSTLTAKELHRRAKLWFVESFRDASAVVQMDDTATKTIIGKAAFKYEPTIFLSNQGRVGTMRYMLQVASKDGKYRVEFSQFTHEAISGLGPIQADSVACGDGVSYRNMSGKPTKFLTRVCNEEVFPLIHSEERKILASLKAAMSAAVVKSDW